MSAIILVEGKDDVNILKNSLLHNNVKIISLDFLAHKELIQNKINHTMIEDYFTQADCEDIDDKVIEFTANWYRRDEMAQFTTFYDINLGELLEIELMNYFFLSLKRTLGIIRVVEKEMPKTIIVASLSTLAHSLCKDKKIEIITHESKTSSTLYFDSIEIPLTIRHKTISIKLSRKNFLFIKKIMTKVIRIMFNFIYKKSNFKKAIMLLDFNPILYKELFMNLNDKSFDTLLLNQRRPAIWNIESLKIVKRSNCKVIELDDFTNNEISNRIQIETSMFLKKLEELWSNENSLQKYFMINDHSFWDGIKNNFIKIVTNRFKECITRILLTEQLLEKISVSVIVEWAHNALEEKIIVHIANKKKIPIILLQHALYPLDSKLKKYIQFNPIIPQNNIKEAIWGNIFREYLSKYKIDDDKIIIVGSPRHDSFFNQNIENDNTVLIATNGFVHTSFNGNHTLAFERLEEYIKKIFLEIKKYPNKKPIVKLHPSQFYYDVKPLINELEPSTPIFQNQNIVKLIASCDFLISLNFSTVLVEAMMLHKPTILILPEEQDFEEELLVKRNATLCINKVDDVESAIHKIIHDKIFREKLIQNGDKFVEDYFTNRGNASEIFAQLIKKD